MASRTQIIIIALQATAALIIGTIAYLVTDALYCKTHIPFDHFLLSNIPLGIAYLLIWFVLFLIVAITISQIIDFFTNPLTAREEQDSLLREVVLMYPPEQAVEICRKSVGIIWGIWKFSRRTGENAFSVMALYENCIVSFVITPIGHSRSAIMIKASFHRRHGIGQDLNLHASQRRCIQVLDTIRNHLQDQQFQI